MIVKKAPKKKNKKKKKTSKKKRLGQNSSMSILRGMLGKKGTKAPKTLPRLRTDAIQKFGVVETLRRHLKKCQNSLCRRKQKEEAEETKQSP